MKKIKRIIDIIKSSFDLLKRNNRFVVEVNEKDMQEAFEALRRNDFEGYKKKHQDIFFSYCSAEIDFMVENNNLGMLKDFSTLYDKSSRNQHSKHYLAQIVFNKAVALDNIEIYKWVAPEIVRHLIEISHQSYQEVCHSLSIYIFDQDRGNIPKSIAMHFLSNEMLDRKEFLNYAMTGFSWEAREFVSCAIEAITSREELGKELPDNVGKLSNPLKI